MSRRKVGRKIALYCVVFALVLTLVLGTVGYTTYKSSLLERYRVYTQSLLETAKSAVDAEGLLGCIEMNMEDQSFQTAQKMLCAVKENSTISYIYMVYFPKPETHRELRFVMNGYTPEEALDPDYISHVGDHSILGEVGDPYADFDYEMARLFWSSLYQNASASQAVRFYVNDTDLYGYQMTGYEPVFAKDGREVGVLALDVSMDEIKDHLNEYLLTVAVAAAALLLVFLVVLLTAFSKSVIKPITGLAYSAHDFVDQTQRAEDAPERLMYKEVPIRTKDEIEMLGHSLTDMTREIKAYMINLKAVVGERERIKAELDLATNIQVSMLPGIFPPFPDRKEIDIYATMDPAKEVGGDFYDFFFLDSDHFCVVMADVSGKGVPAALFMVIAKTLIKNNAMAGLEIHEAFTRTNAQLCENNGAGLFVTAWAGVLEISTGRFTYVNAGHNPPLVKRAGGQYEYLRSRPGFVLAGMEGVKYRKNEMTLEVGDALFLYTDGVTEATNAGFELYGDPRLQCALNAAQDDAPEALLKHVARDVEGFVAGAPQADDITMLGLLIKSRG